MPGLVDAVPLSETVVIGASSVTVRGIGLNTIGEALAKSQDLQRAWAGVQFDAMGLITAIPKTLAHVVAKAVTTKAASQEEIEANAEAFLELDAESQLLIVEAIIRVSFPGGVTPFVNRLGKLAGQDNLVEMLAQYGKELATSSPPLRMN